LETRTDCAFVAGRSGPSLPPRARPPSGGAVGGAGGRAGRPGPAQAMRHVPPTPPTPHTVRSLSPGPWKGVGRGAVLRTNGRPRGPNDSASVRSEARFEPLRRLGHQDPPSEGGGGPHPRPPGRTPGAVGDGAHPVLRLPPAAPAWASPPGRSAGAVSSSALPIAPSRGSGRRVGEGGGPSPCPGGGNARRVRDGFRGPVPPLGGRSRPQD
jgi:hypothetical protein